MADVLTVLGVILAIIFTCAALMNYFPLKGNFERNLDAFVRTRIIPYFHRQRIVGEQFAVLVIARTRDSIQRTKFKPSNWWPWGQPLIDSNYSSFPPRSQISNYVVARPEDGNHAERLLLDNLNTVLTHSFPPPLVVFYTWTMPCTGCTMAIVKALGSTKNVVLVYTKDKKEIDDGENERNRSKLAKCGIQVVQVRYEKDLPQLDKDTQTR